MAEQETHQAGPGNIVPPPVQGLDRPRSPGEMLQAGRARAMEEAKAMVADLAETQRKKAADALGGIAQALRKTAIDLDPENTTMARYTDIAAERLDEVARYLRQAHFNDVIVEAENFARRQPWWFLGGAMATGFIAARMMKSSIASGEAARMTGGRPS